MTPPVQTPVTLVPIRLVKVGRFFMVHLMDPEKLDLSHSFFREVVPDTLPFDRMVELRKWLSQQGAETPDLSFKDTSCIFHVARCGSTLLANNIRDNGDTVVLGEPKFIGGLHRLLADLEPSMRQETLRQIIGSWQKWAVRDI